MYIKRTLLVFLFLLQYPIIFSMENIAEKDLFSKDFGKDNILLEKASRKIRKSMDKSFSEKRKDSPLKTKKKKKITMTISMGLVVCLLSIISFLKWKKWEKVVIPPNNTEESIILNSPDIGKNKTEIVSPPKIKNCPKESYGSKFQDKLKITTNSPNFYPNRTLTSPTNVQRSPIVQAESSSSILGSTYPLFNSWEKNSLEYISQGASPYNKSISKDKSEEYHSSQFINSQTNREILPIYKSQCSSPFLGSHSPLFNDLPNQSSTKQYWDGLPNNSPMNNDKTIFFSALYDAHGKQQDINIKDENEREVYSSEEYDVLEL